MSDIVKRAREFCETAFGPFGVDIEPYTEIIAELIEGSVVEERAENARLQAALEAVLKGVQWDEKPGHINGLKTMVCRALERRKE